MGIVAEVYDGASPSTSLGTLDESRARQWLDQLNDLGNGSLALTLADPDIAICAEGNIVRFSLDGAADVYAIVLEGTGDRTTIDDAEEAGEFFVTGGRGVLALTEPVLVYPELGVDRFSPLTRIFGFPSTDFDDTAWTAAVEIKRQGDKATSPPIRVGQWDDAPKDWPDPHAFWIGARAQTGATPPQPVGDIYLRHEFTVATQGDYAVLFTADDGLEVYLDGEIIAAETRAFMWGLTKRHDTFLDAGTHLLAVKAINLNRAAGVSNVAGFLCSVMATANGGSELTTVVTHTDDTWLALDYPIDPPTMTPGEVIRIAVDEAQARGDLPGVTLGFTDSLDSDGNAWDAAVDLQVYVGTTLLDLVRQLVATSVDVEMTPTLVLEAYNRGGLGADLTGSVELEEGVHVRRLRHSGRGVLGNVGLVRYHTGLWVELDDAGSVATHGRREVHASIGTAPSEKQADRAVQSYFVDAAEQKHLVEGDLVDRGDGNTAYVDWRVGDTILVPNIALVGTASRIRSIAVREPPPSEDGQVGGTPIYSLDTIQGQVGGS